eukprot:4758591-Amphidinium_carterae.1
MAGAICCSRLSSSLGPSELLLTRPLRHHERSDAVLERGVNTVANCEDITCSAGKVFGDPERRSEDVRVGLAKPEWPLVVGKRGRKGVCGGLSFDAGVFHSSAPIGS